MSAPSAIPTAPIHLGFAGSRTLFEDPAPRPALEAALLPQLIATLRQLRIDLALTPDEPLCGISQIAIGADFLFVQACAALGCTHRLFLPQPLDDFLTAGTPVPDGTSILDFTPAQQADARAVLARTNVVEQRVVSTSLDREQRFIDTNLAIAAASDVVVCLLRAGAPAAPGGTAHLQEVALHRGLPVLHLEVSLEHQTPKLEAHWLQLEAFAR